MPNARAATPGAHPLPARGAGPDRFWRPLADRLAHPASKSHLGWPGFGPTPPDPRVNGIDDLVAGVVAQIDRPTALVAQSMGGVIAVRAALAKPVLVTHLVLAVTSGGIDGKDLGAEDWRPALLKSHPSLPTWFTTYQEDLTPRLRGLRVPTLLLWGDADAISPVKIGRRLAALLPRSQLHIFPGGDHDLGNTRAAEIAPLVDRHLVG